MFEPKPPDYYRNWKAIDVYLFDNGQSYSPPRKYHLVADQLEWWPVTLNYLASAQYGLIDRAIDLYTLDGYKIKTPLELKNETAYVAVKSPEPFIKAEYEKYLVRATKSWDKRQSLREHSNLITNAHNSPTPITPLDKAKIKKETSDVKVIQANSIQTPEESILIQTIVNNAPVDKPNLIIMKSTGNTDKRTSQNNMPNLQTIKHNGDKKNSTQYFSGNKNPGSFPQPVPVRKPLYKKRESIKLSDVKITPPRDINQKNAGSVRYSVSRAESSTEGNLPNKTRTYKSIGNRRNSTQPVLSKVHEVVNELKKYSSEKEPNAKQNMSLNQNEIITTENKNPDSNAKNVASLNGNKIISSYDKNADSNVDISAIYIDVTTLKQFKKCLNEENSKEISEPNRDSFNKIVENEIANESKRNIIQTKEELIQVVTESSVNNFANKIENESKQKNIQLKKETRQSREMITDTFTNYPLYVVSKENNVTVDSSHVNVKDNLKPSILMATDQSTENATNVLNGIGVISVTDKYTNIQDYASKPNSQINNLIMNSNPLDIVLTDNKIKDHHSKPTSTITLQKFVNNDSSEANRTDLSLINEKVMDIENNPEKLAGQNTTKKSDIVSSTVNKIQDINLEPTSKITTQNFVNNNIENKSSTVYRVEVETLHSNYLNAQASTLALLSVNDKNEKMEDNSPRSTNEGSDRVQKKVSALVEKEDVVNLKLSIEIWNHNSIISGKPTVASMSHSPYISKQNDSQGNIPVESNIIHKPQNTWIATNEENLKNNQKIVVIKYVPRHSKDENHNSNENPKSDGNNNDIIIILPTLQLDITGCCINGQKEPKNDEDPSQKTQQQRQSSVKFPIRRTTSCMSLLNILARIENREARHADALVNQSKEPSIYYKGTNVSREPSSIYKDVNFTEIPSSMYKDTSSSKDPNSLTRDGVFENRESMCKRKSVAINEEPNGKQSSYSATRISENTYKDQLIVIHDKESEILGKTADKEIQTDWCNLVMEARRQEDGHYALFLPSIEMLKQYKLIC